MIHNFYGGNYDHKQQRVIPCQQFMEVIGIFHTLGYCIRWSTFWTLGHMIQGSKYGVLTGINKGNIQNTLDLDWLNRHESSYQSSLLDMDILTRGSCYKKWSRIVTKCLCSMMTPLHQNNTVQHSTAPPAFLDNTSRAQCGRVCHRVSASRHFHYCTIKIFMDAGDPRKMSNPPPCRWYMSFKSLNTFFRTLYRKIPNFHKLTIKWL